jgi:hypothetical protein
LARWASTATGIGEAGQRAADNEVEELGYGLFGAAEELTDEQIDRQIATNLAGSIQVARIGGQIAFPAMSLRQHRQVGHRRLLGVRRRGDHSVRHRHDPHRARRLAHPVRQRQRRPRPRPGRLEAARIGGAASRAEL